MRSKDFKGRCTKMKLKKCKEIARLYDQIQIAYATILDNSPEIMSIECNVPLEDLEEGGFSIFHTFMLCFRRKRTKEGLDQAP